MIQFSHAYKAYPGGTIALRDVSLNIERGEMVFLMGPSGAGKTTLFRLLAAFDRPTSGEVQVAHYRLSALTARAIPEYRRAIGVVYQDFRLLRDRTVFENVALPLEIRGQGRREIAERVGAMLEKVGLSGVYEKLPTQLSGGEQQRVAIARALIHQPSLLIADEPTGNLDQQMSLEILDLFLKANAQGTTVLVATHDPNLIGRGARRVVRIDSGRVVQS